MSRKNKILALVTLIVVMLSFTGVLYVYMPVCDFCGKKFCFGSCVDDINNNSTVMRHVKNGMKLNQTTTRLAETKKAPENYLDKIYFVGDSRSVGLKQVNIPEERIFADNGLNHVDALTKKFVKINDRKYVTIADAVKITAPEIIIFNFGMNGVNFYTEDNFIKTYEEMLDAVIEASPESIIVLESILPVTMAYDNSVKGINTKIQTINQKIYELAKRKGLFYMGTYDVLVDNYNYANKSYMNSDGIHYNKAGYEVIKNYFLTHAILKAE